MQLVINTPGTFITQKNERFCLKQKEKSFEISPVKVESLIISNQAMITSQAVVMALEHNIDVIFLDSYGDPIGRVWFSKMGSTALRKPLFHLQPLCWFLLTFHGFLVGRRRL
ncbi:MAG: CRISPR-associated endonuclease Cas1 [Deltaproteobacteria bacterium]|nr:CRISPR-associated endonuclease Cas1 [Deltaproteobacteria bacterium]